MRVGILDCDKLPPRQADGYGQYGDMFRRRFEQLAPAWEVRVFDGQGANLPLPSLCDAWLIGGSRHGVYDELDWITALQRWSRAAFAQGVPQVGVCFGHQLLAQALGGEVRRAAQGWGMGPYEIEWVAHGPAPEWLQPAPRQVRLLASHQDQVVKLPPGAELLLTSKFCPHYAWQLDNRVFSLQGHPEFEPAYNRRLAQMRRARIGEAVYRRAITALERPVHSRLAFNWIIRFLGQPRATSGY